MERCGVLRHNREATPEEVFGSLFPAETIDLLVRETNRYADQYFARNGGNLGPSAVVTMFTEGKHEFAGGNVA